MSFFFNVLTVTCMILLCVDSNKPKLNVSRWMTQLNKKKSKSPLISEINIPGTHDSMTMTLDRSAKCNAYNITRQLQFGYRMFDIRLKAFKDGRLEIWHNTAKTPFLWDHFHDASKQFLIDNPGECIIALIKDESTFKDHALFAEKLSQKIKNYIDSNNGGNIYYIASDPHHHIPTIDECQGKIVILSDRADTKQKWWEHGTWTSLNPVNYTDQYIGGDSNGSHFRECWVSSSSKDYEQRRKNFREDLEITMIVGPGNETTFYRVVGNTHSGFCARLDCGTPYHWAKWLNPYMYGQIVNESFTPNVDNNGAITECHQKFYGTILIDVPKTPEEICGDHYILYNEEIAKAIIMSNCDLFQYVDHDAITKTFSNDYVATLPHKNKKRAKLPKDYTAKPGGYTSCNLFKFNCKPKAQQTAHIQYDDDYHDSDVGNNVYTEIMDDYDGGKKEKKQEIEYYGNNKRLYSLNDNFGHEYGKRYNNMFLYLLTMMILTMCIICIICCMLFICIGCIGTGLVILRRMTKGITKQNDDEYDLV